MMRTELSDASNNKSARLSYITLLLKFSIRFSFLGLYLSVPETK